MYIAVFFFQEGSKCSNGWIKVKSGEISKFQKRVRGGDFSKKKIFFWFFMKFLKILYYWYFSQKCLEIAQKWPSNQSKPNNPFHETLPLMPWQYRHETGQMVTLGRTPSGPPVAAGVNAPTIWTQDWTDGHTRPHTIWPSRRRWG